MKLILQHDERDCGAACLSMIATHYGCKMPISRYRELTKTDKSGTNLYGIVDGAEKIGFKAEGLSGSPDELMQGISNREICFPFIAHIVSEDGMLHYVVVYGLKFGKFQIADPGKGKHKMALDKFFSCWTGHIVTFEKKADFQKKNEKRGSFFKFFTMLKGQYRKLAAILALSLVISVIGILGSFVFQIVLDNFFVESSESYVTESVDEEEETEHEHSHEDENVLDQAVEFLANHVENLQVVFSALIFMYLLQVGIQLARSYLIILMSKKIDIRLTLSYYNHIMDLPVSSISVRQTGEYLSRFSDASTIRQAISTATLTLLMDSVMVIAGGAILYMQNKRLFFVALPIVVVYTVIVMVFRKPIERNNRSVMENDARLQSYLKESIDGIETVKAACAEHQSKEKTIGKFTDFIDSIVKSSMISALQDTLSGTTELIGTVIILWQGFGMALSGQVTVGSVMTFYVLLAYFTEPIKNLVELQPTIQTAFVAADRLNDILDLQSEPLEENQEILPVIDKLEFQNVDFRYGNRELTLENVSFSIYKGDRIAIVGESGSGKTTLAKLLLRFYEPESGNIMMNGEKIENLDLHALRQAIAYVDQNTFLFSDSIKDNLKLGNAKATDEEIEKACTISRADEFIKKLPWGYDTPLDENGMNLSGGQRQRLAIARALLKKPQILILDEATSNLDTITEAGIKSTISQSDKDITYIIIAHRLTTVKDCSCILVMENGKLAESGTHDQLMKKGGLYAKLWNMQ